ncbi:hypothetical protein LPC27_17325 [Paraclostridium bifermentans]|uniref:hypothetical protein n=1 Tax=Paraclostridium bifermentans TaxID=1490 RepID=UPI001F370393|nr:hypothetical protein [Paraclostridium bifermentans]MCE9677544.1 hypothetical protein [Paraclostridium bifermentans]
MGEYIAHRIIEKANGGDGLEYKLVVPKWVKYKEDIDKNLISEGRGDLIVSLEA